MRIQLVQTTGWYSEGGQSTWGFGIEVAHFAGQNDNHEWEPEGWRAEILLGPWAIQISSEAGFKSIVGDSAQYYGTFSVERP